MSYDVHLYIVDALGEDHVLGDWNCTSNLSPAWRAAGAHIHDWDGHFARYVTPELREAVRLFDEHPERFRKYEPDNGWGTVHGCVNNFLRPMLNKFERFPDGIVGVSR